MFHGSLPSYAVMLDTFICEAVEMFFMPFSLIYFSINHIYIGLEFAVQYTHTAFTTRVTSHGTRLTSALHELYVI